MKQGEVNLDFILFNVGKHLYQTQKEVTGWKNRWLKNGKVFEIDEDKIDLYNINENGKSEGLKELYYNLSKYPFLYYREMVSIEDGAPVSYQSLTMFKDLKQVRELMLEELTLQDISILRVVVLYYCDLLPFRILVDSKGYKELHSLATLGSVDNSDEDLEIEIVLDIYEVEQEGKDIEYFYTTVEIKDYISSLPGDIKVFMNGKEIEYRGGVSFV